MDAPAAAAAPRLSVAEIVRGATAWSVGRPLGALGALLSFAGFVYFFGFYFVFFNGMHSVATWAWVACNAENNQEHAKFILPGALILVWWHSGRIARAERKPSNFGLGWIIAGVAAYLLAVRCLQPRIAVAALPMLIYGSVLFLWGRKVARIVLFPCAFLLFMIPIGGIVQGTVSLQLFVSSVVNVLSHFVGAKIEASGTMIKSLDGSFTFEIAEGCSGIRSLMAMTTLTAVYVHFTQRELWKKIAVFVGSIGFAVIGNIGRVFSVVLAAKFFGPRVAEVFHDWSGLFIFFPVAVASMTGFGNLLNANWFGIYRKWTAPENAPAGSGNPDRVKTASPVSYDY